MTAFTAGSHPTGTGFRLELAGELDFQTAPRLREELVKLELLPGQQLVFDLSELTFCDSTGLTAFVAARNQALAVQAEFVLSAVPDQVLRILRISGLDQALPVIPG